MSFPVQNKAPVDRAMKGNVFNVGPSKTCRIELPVGLTYLDFEIECKVLGVNPYPGTVPALAVMEASFDRIRVFLDGELRYDVPFAEYVQWFSFYRDIIGATGYIPLMMSMPWNSDPNTPAKPGADDLGAKINGAWGTKNHSSFVIELDQSAASTIDYIDIRPTLHPVATDLGLHARPVRLTHNLNTLGQSDWIIPFKEKGGFCYGIHLLPPTLANLTYITLLVDGVPYKQGTVEQLHRPLLRPTDKRTIQTGWAHIDLAARNFDDDALPFSIIDDNAVLQLTFANAAPGTFPIWLTQVSPDTRAPSKPA